MSDVIIENCVALLEDQEGEQLLPYHHSPHPLSKLKPIRYYLEPKVLSDIISSDKIYGNNHRANNSNPNLRHQH